MSAMLRPGSKRHWVSSKKGELFGNIIFKAHSRVRNQEGFQGYKPFQKCKPQRKVIFRSYSVTKNEILVTSLIIGQIAFN